MISRSDSSTSPGASARTASRTAGARSTATPIAAARATLGLGTRLVHDEVAVPEQATVQHLDRLGRFLLRGHLDEAESPGAAGELIRNDTDRFHRSGLCEQFAQVLLGGLEGKVTDEELCGHRANLLPMTQRRTPSGRWLPPQHRLAQD